ncbi:MAG: acetyl-CoA carboxylase biotin carboxylase subunit [candidate division WOR-3 bacterium]
MKFKRILIANRGEIAVRIINACKELGIETVAVYSEADRESLHVKLADEAICIGPAPLSESYLNPARIISSAEITGCDAIHPGYGMFAENPDFAEMVITSGFKFIGPSPEIIEKMGDKIYAKNFMKKAGVKVVPGSEEPIKELKEGLEIAREIGFPVLIKAAGGGGGRGMRISRNEKDFEVNFRTAKAEALAAFKDDRVYIEKFIENPKHIEVQVAGNGKDIYLHFFERECSIQRRHQKLIEEAPSPSINEEERKKLLEMAINGIKALKYDSVGTMEFIMDENKNFYFIEMNTRIQVEHPVTEFITGIDLIKLQIKIAEGENIDLKQEDIYKKGHAIEIRINAEDTKKGFLPSPAKIEKVHFPGGPGIRIDSYIYNGYKIPPYYDSLIAKLIVYGINREEAIKRLQRCLDEIIIEGPCTTIPFYKFLIKKDKFLKGNYTTNFVEEIMNEWLSL